MSGAIMTEVSATVPVERAAMTLGRRSPSYDIRARHTARS